MKSSWKRCPLGSYKVQDCISPFLLGRSLLAVSISCWACTVFQRPSPIHSSFKSAQSIHAASPCSHIFVMELPHPVMAGCLWCPSTLNRKRELPRQFLQELGRAQQCTEGAVLSPPAIAGPAQPPLWRTVHGMEHGRMTACRNAQNFLRTCDQKGWKFHQDRWEELGGVSLSPLTIEGTLIALLDQVLQVRWIPSYVMSLWTHSKGRS